MAKKTKKLNKKNVKKVQKTEPQICANSVIKQNDIIENSKIYKLAKYDNTIFSPAALLFSSADCENKNFADTLKNIRKNCSLETKTKLWPLAYGQKCVLVISGKYGAKWHTTKPEKTFSPKKVEVYFIGVQNADNENQRSRAFFVNPAKREYYVTAKQSTFCHL